MSTEEVRDHLRDQRGLITRVQATSAGLTRSAIEHRVRSGDWERVHPSVFRLAGIPISWHQSCLAAVLWLDRSPAGDAAAVSHLSALRLWGLDAGMPRDQLVDVSVARSTRGRTGRVAVRRVGGFDPRDLAVRAGIAVTGVELTLRDVAPLVVAARLEKCTEDAIRARLTTADRLDVALERLGGSGRSGAAQLRTVLDARRVGGPAPADGELELATWRLLRSSGLPMPVRQHCIDVDGIHWSVDFFWPGTGVGLETDGYTSHAGRQAFQQDRRKLRALGSNGYRILPATWWDVTVGHDALLRDLERALANAA